MSDDLTPDEIRILQIPAELDALDGDQEVCHSQADKLLVEYLICLGQTRVARAFEEAKERVGFWYA